MAYTTINKGTDHFNTKLYTGTASGNQSVTGVGFQPDWVWTKTRSSADGSNLYDSVRGVGKYLQSNGNSAESTSATSMVSFDSDGFTVGTGDNVQYGTSTGVSWNWKAGGTASSNTDGDITSNVSVNTTAGFSIGTYTGSGTDGDTVGTGLTGLSLVIAKCRNATGGWVVKHQSLSGDNNVYLQSTNAAGSAASAGSGGIGALNDSTFPLVTGTSGASSSQVNKSGNTHVFYAFAEKKGYSKFGIYTGIGSTDGTFVYTGFKPAFLITKRTDSATSGDWNIVDSVRNPSNVVGKYLHTNLNNAEGTASIYDILSNGFKIRESGAGTNAYDSTYIYMAFAEAPIVGTNNVPATAR